MMKKFLKKSRKGFTLVELLIAIILLGALVATVMLNSGNAIANAKAETIVANMTKVKDAVWFYCAAEHYPSINDFKDNVKTYLGDKAGAIKREWDGYYLVSSDNIQYGVFPENINGETVWKVQCLYDKDPDKDAIRVKLAEMANSARLLQKNFTEKNKPYTVKDDKEYKVVMRIDVVMSK